MTDLRLILLGAGVLVIAAIIVEGLWRRKRDQRAREEFMSRYSPESSRTAQRLTPVVNTVTAVDDKESDYDYSEEETVRVLNTTQDEPLETATVYVAAPASEPVRASAPEIEDVPLDDYIALTVLAKPGERFGGFDLLQALLKCGLKHGRFNVFHRHKKLDDSESAICFSVASVTAPGIFDIKNMQNMTTRGLSLFMSVPDLDDAPDVFEIMLSTARQLATRLNGNLGDRQRQPLTEAWIAACRARARIGGNIQQQLEDLKALS
ncbi:MAG: cell division protein ZipA [Gammaproteobacteria bacterium]|nr:cell division protein ZipA [Gammaproteobacteria bacterium]